MQQPVVHTPVSRFTIPRFPFIVMLLVIVFLLAIMVVGVLAKRLSAPSLPDLFAPYADIFPGQHVDLPQLEAQGFVCDLDPQPSLSDISEHCWQNLQTDSFSQVNVMIWDGVVKWLSLAVREDTLTIGDLVLLWGNPDVEISGSLVIVRWSDQHMMASGRSFNGRFTYFQPLAAISLEMAA